MPKIPDVPNVPKPVKPERKTPEKVDPSLENVLLFLSQEFSIEEGEIKVKYAPITELCYRINFYKNISKNKWPPSYVVNRTYFVTLNKVEKVYSIKSFIENKY